MDLVNLVVREKGKYDLPNEVKECISMKIFYIFHNIRKCRFLFFLDVMEIIFVS